MLLAPETLDASLVKFYEIAADVSSRKLGALTPGFSLQAQLRDAIGEVKEFF